MEWTRGPTLGRGSTAAVSLAATTTGDLFAVKSTDLSSSTLLQREECLISQLCSPYVIKSLGSDITCENSKSLYNLFLEYVPGGTLSDHIRRHGRSLDEDLIRFYAHRILLGLNYLHAKGMVHCDIKGQNILIGNDSLKIADFGCAKWIDCGDSVKFTGTPAYMSPEVARGEEQGFPADIWALGCTVIEMATGSNPWLEMKNPASALYRIAYSGDVPEIPVWFSGNARDFVAKCLIRDSKERRTAAELLEHPFLKSVEDDCTEIRKSPTSVMDLGFWDDLEVQSPSENCTEIASSFESSAAGRIGALIGDDFPTNLSFVDWDEEDWITVRCNEIEDNSIVEDYEDLVDDEEEGILISISVDDYFLDCFNYEFSNIDENYNRVFPIIHNYGVKYELVFRIIEFEKLLMELLLHLDHFFLQKFYLYSWLYILSNIIISTIYIYKLIINIFN